ncbi:MAG: 4-hydroxy-3-methylbut-2-enyl diphosphate reductase [Cytophagaceae bacterium]|nr:4-hydroxy-3-methylbut-2-enyl diphosphate reductase [Cytophagaceae bacterium]
MYKPFKATSTEMTHNTQYSSDKPVRIVIDSESGFCFGVSRAVSMAEEILKMNEPLTSLGDIVHNNEEVIRLERKGMETVLHRQLDTLKNRTVLLRAHGEPPATYRILKKQNVKIVDATCPVVLKLQHSVRKAWEEAKISNAQIVIYGKKGHPEVVGLLGQTDDEAIVISSVDDIGMLNPARPVEIFSQTTMSNSGLDGIEQKVRETFASNVRIHRTICRQVENRAPHLKDFAGEYDLVIFVGGEKSSNGRMLFEICRQANPRTCYAYSENSVREEWFVPAPRTVGICGATSTPHWLMEKVAKKTNEFVKKVMI